MGNEVLILRPRGPMSSTCIQETVTGHLSTQILRSFLHLAPLTCLFFYTSFGCSFIWWGKGQKITWWILGKKIIGVVEKLPFPRGSLWQEGERRLRKQWVAEEGHHFKCITLTFGFSVTWPIFPVFIVIIYIYEFLIIFKLICVAWSILLRLFPNTTSSLFYNSSSFPCPTPAPAPIPSLGSPGHVITCRPSASEDEVQ